MINTVAQGVLDRKQGCPVKISIKSQTILKRGQKKAKPTV